MGWLPFTVFAAVLCALGRRCNMIRYSQIVFMEGDDAREALEILGEGGAVRAIDYLREWEQERHDYRAAPSAGTRDHTYRHGDYILTWNLGLGYIGLERVDSDGAWDAGDLAIMVRSYLATALWSTNDESNEQGGNPLDANYTTDDCSAECEAQAQRECALFVADAGGKLRNQDPDCIGHDFWLTRNGHGAGFWDGDYAEPLGTELTTLAKSFGEVWMYVGDDGRIHTTEGKPKVGAK